MNPDPAAFRYIGKPQPRTEDDRLLRGLGQFTDDFNGESQLYAAVVRSPYAHARIRSVDTGPALAIAGVRLVLTGDDLASAGLGPIDHRPLPKTRFDLKLRGPGDSEVFTGPHYLLPRTRARHVGEAIAFVVAESLALAYDGAEAVNVDYEELAPVIDVDAALANDAISVWEECSGNTLVDTSFGDARGTDEAFEAADHVVHEEFVIQRVTGVPLEPRSALGRFDQKSGRYTLHAGSGGAVKQKSEIASVLNADPDQVRVFCYDVGGNFGTRNRTYVEFALVLWAAKLTGCSVKFTATRSEAFLSDYQGRDFVSRVSLALSASGKFLGLRADNISNVGSRCVSLSPLGKGSSLVTGPYAIPVASLRARAVFTHTVPTQAYRSSGRPEVTYVIEQLVEKAARECGFDPLELRRQNLVSTTAMPYTNALGARYDSGDYVDAMDQILEHMAWDDFSGRKAEAARRGMLLGRGFASYVESSIGFPRERAQMIVDNTGQITVVIGTQSSGQGHETSFAQVAADLLDVEFDVVRVVYSDTDLVTLGGGSHSGRSMRHAGVVIGKAATALIERARNLAAEHFEVSADALDYVRGVFSVPGTDLHVSLASLATTQSEERLIVVEDNEMHDPVFPNGAAVCEVEIDPDTGDSTIVRYGCIDDVGRCINPLIVHGQAHGAIVQGVGQAMGERVWVEPTSGQVITGSFMDYQMPRADEFPLFETLIAEVISPTNPLGIKAGGEGGTTPSLTVYTSAVTDALKGYGVTRIDLPITSSAVFAAIHDTTNT